MLPESINQEFPTHITTQPLPLTSTATTTTPTTLESLATSYSSSSETELLLTPTTIALATAPLPDAVQTVYEGDNIWIGMVTVCPQVEAQLRLVSTQLFTLADLASPAIGLELAAVVAVVLTTATQM
eukprot:Protomagalhaensia_wolfi_Nauph_80__5694@NODE_672_length_2143_cov_298_650665_g499_i0_p2_GENE_NODE_672_length_2143_cov_298_650665_g499_i0NODE_672_length_2143_cov_298_650665_g499_i0_p2_ORF_typecomplete_len127_score9_20_NODE_672_length_2143_cov_298_650665_g499_i06691049